MLRTINDMLGIYEDLGYDMEEVYKDLVVKMIVKHHQAVHETLEEMYEEEEMDMELAFHDPEVL
jgi:tartrate dehydratase alpha subunit/fumarate hydratase class I-like protein